MSSLYYPPMVSRPRPLVDITENYDTKQDKINAVFRALHRGFREQHVVQESMECQYEPQES